MKKRFLSLLCVLALCLGLLPVTALAVDAPATLYVGNQQVIKSSSTTYWTTDNSGGLTLVDDATDANDWTVRYDPNTATLTLKDATIETTHTQSGAVIYAESAVDSAVSLTINLEGTNKIECNTASYGIYVNAEMASDSYGTDASLTITGTGSLAVSGSTHGIWVKSGSGNASLTINSASVEANTSTNPYSAGVNVQSSTNASVSPNLSLAVNGGSLTASGGTSSDGIQFYVSNPDATNAITSLTVTGNAIVDAKNGGISALRILDPLPTPTPTGENSSGIVFDGTEGTVYGNVTLDESLTINQGETLTIPEGSSLTVPDGKTLTNNGTVTTTGSGSLTNSGTINNSGTLPDNIQGSAPPKITTPSLSEGTVNAAYSQTLAATGESITWSVASGSTLPDGLNLENDTITGTPTTAGDSTFIVTATNTNGSDSKEYTLTINPAPVLVTGISLNNSNLSLYTGKTATLTATVTPENATNKAVTWKSSDDTIATVDNNGKVTAVKEGTATITATAADGSGVYATCTVTVNQSTYSISADTTAIDFGSAYTSYTQPAAKTVTITNTGNQDVTVTLPTSTNYIITAGEGFTDSTATLAPSGTATFTVQPKAGLAVDTYNETITVTGTNDVSLSIPVTFRVRQYISPPTKTPSQQAMDKIEAAKDGDTVEITLSTGNTKLDKEVFEELAGQDITLVVKLSGGVSWTVNGQDIPENATLTDLNMGVSMNTSTIPVNLINMVTGEKGAVQMTLAHDGEFGFAMTLTAPVGTENKGLWANLYHYDTTRKQMLFETAAQVDASGNVALKFSHASEYAIVLDTKSHELPFDDVNVGDWFQAAVEYVYRNGIMTGTSATTFEPGTTLSRAMVAQILYNLEGQPDISEENLGYPYSDVDTEAWYGDAVYWARINGVATGYEDNTFRPNRAVTREELAQMLYNYAKYKDYDLTASGDLTAFPDGEEVSSWAETAMAWANGNKLINGFEDDTLRPGGDCTRAQAASILMNFDVKLAN